MVRGKIGFYPRAGNATKDSVAFLNKDGLTDTRQCLTWPTITPPFLGRSVLHDVLLPGSKIVFVDTLMLA